MVTNLRIPKEDWLELKVLAAGLGISVNQYLNTLIDKYAVKHAMAPDVQPRKLKKKQSPWEALRQLSKTVKKEPSGELSEDDKIIYET